MPRSSPAPTSWWTAARRRFVEVALAPHIDLVSTSTFVDGHPWDQYAWLRANDPVHLHTAHDGEPFWALTKYDDIRAVSRNPKLFSSSASGVMVGTPDEGGLAAQRLMMLRPHA